MGMDVAGSQGSLSDQADNFAGDPNNTCVNSQEQIFSPIQIKKVGNASSPGFEQPVSGDGETGPYGFGANQIGATSSELNPYFSKVFGDDGSAWIRETDFQMMGNDGIAVKQPTNGETARDLNIRKTQDRGAISLVQVNGLRGPMILSGFGFDIADRPVPNMGSGGGEVLEFDSRAPGDRTTWKTGPVNLQWDDERKVWQGGPQIVCGVVEGDIKAPTDPCNPEPFVVKVFRLDGYTEGGTLSNCLLSETITCQNRDPSLTQVAVPGQIFVVATRINYEWIPIWVGCPDEGAFSSSPDDGAYPGDPGYGGLPSCVC